MEPLKPKIQFKSSFPSVFYERSILSKIYSFLPENTIKVIKGCLKKTGAKEQKKKIKEIVKKYVKDLGKHNEKVKYAITEEGVLTIQTNIFNVNTSYIKQFTHIKYNKEILELDKDELYQYLHVFPKNDITLSNNDKSVLKVSKTIIPYDVMTGDEEEIKKAEEKKEEEKYEMFYKEENIEKLKNMDFSNKETLLEHQKQMLQKFNEVSVEEFFPLQFISGVQYWSIILCEGGYFAYGLFLKDELIEHKSDHKYVVRKKAGQRRIAKDKTKKIKSSIGAAMRRANERKHQENIEYILKLKEDLLLKADCIFIQAPGVNKSILIGEGKTLVMYKGKIMNIQFNVPKANYTNVMNVYKKITTVHFGINDTIVQSLFK